MQLRTPKQVGWPLVCFAWRPFLVLNKLMCLRSCVGEHLGTYRLLSACSIRWQQNRENHLKWLIHKLQTLSILAKTCLMHMFKISFVIREMLSAECTSSFAALAHQKHKTFILIVCLLQLMPIPTSPHVIPQAFLHPQQLGNQPRSLQSLAAEFSGNFW